MSDKKQCFKKLNFFSAAAFLSRYFLSYKKYFVKFYVACVLDMILAVISPILFGIMIDEIVYYQNLETFLSISVVFIAITVFTCLLWLLRYYQYHYLTSMYEFSISRDLFQHFQKSDAQYLSNVNSGDLISMIQLYTHECLHFLVRNIHTSNNIISAILFTTYIFIISWQVGLLVLVAVPVAVIVSVVFGKKTRGYADAQRQNYGGYIGWAFEMLSALGDIRMLDAVGIVRKNFVGWQRKIYKNNIRSGILNIFAQNIISLTNLLIQLAIFTFAGYLALHNQITMGLLVVILTFFNMLVQKVKFISGTHLDTQVRISYIQRIYDFLHSDTEDSWEGKQNLVVTEGKIQFNHVDFAYKGSGPLLEDFSLTINAGEKLALVGKSGCGKTTLAYMLIGFYRPQAGYIEIDGQNLADCSLKSIRQNIGLVAQDVLLFDGTIRENILLGRKNAGDEEIITACQQAGIWGFIQELPNGLDTVVGTQGVGLSGGQKQRLAITRIYLKNPQIIIFDEATSALDSESEDLIHEAWKSVLAGRTAIVIAHRQSSVMLCEKAAILDEGQIIQVGNPTQLAREDEAFRSLFALKGGEAHD